jgi:hypothetical protein
MNKNLVQAKNEQFYIIVRKDFVVNQVPHVVGERDKKYVSPIFYLCLVVF